MDFLMQLNQSTTAAKSVKEIALQFCPMFSLSSDSYM
jgi:hypothetical protein